MKLNNLTYVILSFVYFIFIVVSNSMLIYLCVIGLTYLHIILFRKFKIKIFIITLLLTLPTWLSFYIAKVIFSNNGSNHDIVWLLTMRVSAITISSIMLISTLNFEEFILYLMQHWKLPVVIGYPCLSAINAVANFKEEYIRIKNAYLMRYGKSSYSLLILYPMLISATRYALQNGLSMEARGLNKNKTFIYQTGSLKLIDLMVIIVNIVILLEIKQLWQFIIINTRYLCQI